jgi:hypothetical protein
MAEQPIPTTTEAATGLTTTAIEQFKGRVRGTCSFPVMPTTTAPHHLMA